jgi:hypothetical protein
MCLRRVAAKNKDKLSVIYLIEVYAGCSSSYRGRKTCDRWRVSDPRWIINIVRLKNTSGYLLKKIVLFVACPR